MSQHLHSNATTRPPDSLSGLIKGVTFFQEDTGFAVLKVKARGVP